MLNIVLFGAPGSGKGTQSANLETRYGLTHISTGELLREEIAEGTSVGHEVQALISEGHLVSDELIFSLLKKAISNHPDAKGFILDGFPRTTKQAELLDQLLEENNQKISLVLYLEVEHDTLIQRLLDRGTESHRADDNKSVIINRLNVYMEQTLPVLAYYKKDQRATTIDNNSTIDYCMQQVNRAVDQLT